MQFNFQTLQCYFMNWLNYDRWYPQQLLMDILQVEKNQHEDLLVFGKSIDCYLLKHMIFGGQNDFLPFRLDISFG